MILQHTNLIIVFGLKIYLLSKMEQVLITIIINYNIVK